MRFIPILILLICGTPFSFSQSHWETRHSEWTEADEIGFSRFVQAIGESTCRTVSDCFRSEANPFRHTDPRNVRIAGDCADLPYLLRGYYSWKNQLPFSYVAGVEAAREDEPGTDIRYTWYGNRVIQRHTPSSRRIAGWTGLRAMINTVSTAMFRVDPREDAPDVFSDFYPVEITRESIRPGTVVYDPRGHVAVVYKVEDDGRVRLLNAHPDNSVTRTVYGPEYTRQRPELGGGFLNWRPQGMENGRITAVPNYQLRDYSLVQYFGTRPDPYNWERGMFYVNDQLTMDFQFFVRMSLILPGNEPDPVVDMERTMQALCNDLQDRVIAVERARQDGIARRAHPARLPLNIYGTEGDWETYSTPGRDARLRASFVAAYQLAARAPGHLHSDILVTYEAQAAQCGISYVNSAGQSVRLNFEDVVDRLFALSFDPYHCPELRWGAEGSELASCPDDHDKLRWYTAQQNLRHVIDRDVQVQMGWSLTELEQRSFGPASAPEVDVRRATTLP